MKLKLVYHKETNKVLGGQIIGENGVDKRINVLATAILNIPCGSVTITATDIAGQYGLWRSAGTFLYSAWSVQIEYSMLGYTIN